MSDLSRLNVAKPIGCQQKGTAVIEFPFVVLALLVMVWGLTSAYRFIDMHLQLDNVTFSLANSVAVTEEIAQKKPHELRQNLESDLLIIAKRLLPKSLNDTQIGIVIESWRVDSANNSPINGRVKGGYPCTVDTPLAQLNSLSPKGNHSDIQLTKQASLLQVTVCIDKPFSQFHALSLPDSISSSAVMIHRTNLSD